jgi:hypothetical protein
MIQTDYQFDPYLATLLAYSGTAGSASASHTQFVQQRLGLLEIAGLEAFGEPAVDLR